MTKNKKTKVVITNAHAYALDLMDYLGESHSTIVMMLLTQKCENVNWICVLRQLEAERYLARRTTQVKLLEKGKIYVSRMSL